MPRIRTVLTVAVLAALGAAIPLASPAPAQAAWQQLGCAPTAVRYARICLYRDTNDSNRAQGRYINNSDFNLKTQGVFWPVNSANTIGCAQAITEAGTTSVCTRTLPRGRFYLGAYTWKGSEYLGFTATADFAFGR